MNYREVFIKRAIQNSLIIKKHQEALRLSIIFDAKLTGLKIPFFSKDLVIRSLKERIKKLRQLVQKDIEILLYDDLKVPKTKKKFGELYTTNFGIDLLNEVSLPDYIDQSDLNNGYIILNEIINSIPIQKVLNLHTGEYRAIKEKLHKNPVNTSVLRNIVFSDYKTY